MFFSEGQLRVFLYGEPVSMRRSFDGLYALARHGMQRDPLSGNLFAFINRRATQIKVLYFDRTGLCLWAKRLEQGRLVSDWAHVASCEMDWTGLKLLLEGIEPKQVRKRYKNRPVLHKNLGACPHKYYNGAMQLPPSSASKIVPPTVALSAADMAKLLDALERELVQLRCQVAWFQRQFFGQKSERRLPESNGVQGKLG